MSKIFYSVAVHTDNNQKHPELKNKPVTPYMFFNAYRCASKADAEVIIGLLLKRGRSSDYWIRSECETCGQSEQNCNIICGVSIE